ncbi:hypothetical protein C8J57DRAFT_1245948 [Mycena rebaudengoi]|nr:hypothetical protein C8J57DRAFT_1245948 [Mycena rebaudengoi]
MTLARCMAWTELSAMLRSISTRSATPSSGYSFNPYDNYQSSNHSGPSSELKYLSASSLSAPSSGLDFFDDNAPEPNLDWSPSLAAFFDSVETPALESSSNPSFLPPNNLSFALPRYTLLPIYQPFSHHVERYELDPHARDAVNNTQIIQRLNQGSVIQDKVICGYLFQIRVSKKDTLTVFRTIRIQQ